MAYPNQQAGDEASAYAQGLALHKQGRFAQAVQHYRSALAENPGAAHIHLNLGAAHFQGGDHARALACFEEALRWDPHMAEAFFNGGNALRMLQRLDEAAHWYARAVEIQPAHADAHYNLGNLCKSFGRLQEAVIHYRKAVSHQPAFDMAWNNLGIALLELNRTDDAQACFFRAKNLNPNHIDAQYNLALSCKWQGRVDSALYHVEQVLARQPDHGPALALWVPLLQQNCDWTKLSAADRRLEKVTCRQLTLGDQPAESPFLSFSRTVDPQRNLEVARAWSRILSERLAAERLNLAGLSPHGGSHDGPITIGYLSEQFRDAATAHLTAGLFACHDRETFHIIAYSLGDDDGSHYRRRIEQGVDRFVDIRNLSVSDAALRMRADRVDILVDLIGWMHGHRMGILSLRPAPIQVNYLGFPGTTGADFVDYIVADATVIPPAHQRFYSEKVICLPHCYQATDPHPPVYAGCITRATCGLPENSIVFASFNTDYKIEVEVFSLWMKILQAVPDSVLWLLVRTQTAEKNLRSEAQARGIDPRRLIFADAWHKEKHLARLRLADVALDTLTVNGHTTTTDALWSGVPVVTLQGNHFASRVAASALKAVGMAELITHSPDAYQRLAVRLAAEPDLLAAVRHKLNNQKKTYPLFDVQQFTRHLESAYQTMWRRYKDGRQPSNFDVKES